MKSPDLRYILVKDDGGTVKGFTSLMPTFENHEPVLYCYEVHLLPELQGQVLSLVFLFLFLSSIQFLLPDITASRLSPGNTNIFEYPPD